MYNKLHTPAGMKDFLPGEYSTMLRLKLCVAEVFEKAGYGFVTGPTLEYADVFEGKGSTRPGQMFRFVDRDGEILALRPDMTPPVARMAVTNFDETEYPLRLCYIENVFRQNQNYQGKQREFTQGGIELMGIKTVAADFEVIKTAIKCCMACGLQNFRIDIGQVQYLKGLLEEAGLNADEESELMNCILLRDYAGVTALTNIFSLPAETRNFLINLPLMTGGLDILQEAKKINENSGSIKAIIELESIYNLLIECSLGKYVHFDLGMIGHLDYYTGVIFRGFAPGTGYSILDGGRYDNLCTQFGADIPSVGFAVNLNNLSDAVALSEEDRV